MGFEGTVSLSSETIQQVMVEAVESLIRHGFKRFLFLSAHGGNAAATWKISSLSSRFFLSLHPSAM